MDWQKNAIWKTYDNEHRTRRCIISVGRKSAKTKFAACLPASRDATPAARTGASGVLLQLFGTERQVQVSPDAVEQV